MKPKTLLTPIFVLLGLAVVTTSAFFLGRLVSGLTPVSASGDPPLPRPDLPPQTVNGITAQIKSYYADANHLVFVVQIEGEAEDYSLDNISLQEAGREIHDSYEVQSLPGEASLFSVDIVTSNPVEEERLDGQFAFTVFASNGEDPPLANFQFDFSLPIPPRSVFNPKRSVSANGVEILLDRLVIAPTFTQAYLCYRMPTNADWGISNNTALQVNSQIGSMETYSLLFDDKLADGSKGGERGWTPPVKVGRCVKIGFRVGDAHPKSLTLTIPALEQSIPEVVPAEELAAAYEKLKAEGIDMEWHQVDHGAYPEYKKLPEGMTGEEAFQHFAEALGYVYPGEWKFELSLDSQ